ncbi:MAG TPA: TatD family hydrolase [Candidatus Limnocylindrales bacterium]
MRLIDSHCHLQSDRFDADRDAVIERARAAGLERILVPGWTEETSRAAIQLVAQHPWLDAAAGIHPHEAERAGPAEWEAIVRLARDHRVAAVGETGLDYDRAFSPVPVQRDNLRRHLDLGLDLQKPVIIHCRSAAGSSQAHDDVLELLEAAGIRATERARHERPAALIHSFSGTPAFAGEVLARGLAISISGLAFRAGEEATLGEVAGAVPPERLLVETDSPFLSPPGGPRRRNEPAWVAITAERVAVARGGTPEALGEALVAAYDRTVPRPS